MPLPGVASQLPRYTCVHGGGPPAGAGTPAPPSAHPPVRPPHARPPPSATARPVRHTPPTSPGAHRHSARGRRLNQQRAPQTPAHARRPPDTTGGQPRGRPPADTVGGGGREKRGGTPAAQGRRREVGVGARGGGGVGPVADTATRMPSPRRARGRWWSARARGGGRAVVVAGRLAAKSRRPTAPQRRVVLRRRRFWGIFPRVALRHTLSASIGEQRANLR